MKRIFAAIFAVIFIATLSITAFADTGINNAIKGENTVQTVGTVYASGADLIRATGDQEKITMPNYEDYFDYPAVRYVDAPKNHSIYVYKSTDTNGKTMPSAHDGLKVLEVAQRKGMSCIVYHDREFEQHAGWVSTKNLKGTFPGEEMIIGYSTAGMIFETEVPQMSWSRDPFVGTEQKYVSLRDSVKNCTQIKLAYQVTNLDNVRFEDTLGTRTVYINDGSGWTSVGQFDYHSPGAVLATINLTEPTELRAVAVIPSCNQPDRFLSRIEIQNLYVC